MDISHIIVESANQTIHLVPRVILIMFVTLILTHTLVQLGFFRKLEPMARPLALAAHLPCESSIAFISSIGSTLTANTMIAKFYRDGTINRKEATLSAILNTTPVYLKEAFTYQLAVVLPALGVTAGSVYFFTFLLVGAIKIVFVILYGRIALKRREVTVCPTSDEWQKPTLKDALSAAIKKQGMIFARIGLMFTGLTYLTLFATNAGLSAWLSQYISPLTLKLSLPASTAIPIGTFMVSPLIGVTSIGALIRSGEITEYCGVLASLLGGFLMIPVFFLKHGLPTYGAIFGLRVGISILIISMGLGMLVRGGAFLFFLFLRVC